MIWAAGKGVNKSYRFLKSSCRHKLINLCRKPDVPAQTHRVRLRHASNPATGLLDAWITFAICFRSRKVIM